MDLIFVMLMYFVSFEFRKMGVKSIYNMTMVTELLTDGVQIIFFLILKLIILKLMWSFLMYLTAACLKNYR